MVLLLLSLLALAVAPLIFRFADRASTALAALDGFVVISVAGLVTVHVIPHAIEHAGFGVLVVAILGFFGPGWAEHALHRAADRVHSATMYLAVGGLLVHSFFDGVGLADTLHHQHTLSIAVLLHRLPIAITVWWLLRPRGLAVACAVLTGIAVMTVGGYVAADAWGHSMESTWLSYVQALIGGSLLHVVVHRPAPVAVPGGTGKRRFAAGVGALVGLVSVALLSTEHIAPVEALESDFVQMFLTLALESAPALLFAFALAGVVQVLLPGLALSWLRRGGSLGRSARGVAFGLPLPICSCGVVPLYQSLVEKGVPATAAMAFLVATPELGIDALLISFPLLGLEMSLLRLVVALLVALIIGVVVGGYAERHSAKVTASDENSGPAGSLRERLVAGLRYGFVEIVDHTGPWIILGIVVASLVGPVLRSEWITELGPGMDVVLFALLGMPTYVCASGATPLVAVLIMYGVSPGAGLAFLLSGPATNVTTFGVLSKLHGRKVAALFAVMMATLAVVIGIGVNAWMGEGLRASTPSLDTHEDAGLAAIISLCLLGMLYIASILRQGPRGFLAQVHSPFDEGGGHSHDHHGHDHHGHHHH